MGILERLKAAAGRVTGRERAAADQRRTERGRPGGREAARANRGAVRATGGGDDERNVGG